MKKFGLFFLILLLSPLFYTQAQSVDLIIQGESYTPPFYLGRTLWSKQSKANFLAIPNNAGNPSSLIYKWKRDGTVLGSLSGVGKNTLSLNDVLFSKPQVIEVEILDNSEESIASSTLMITPTSQTIIVYENNPLYGFMFNKEAMGTYKLTDREITFTAFPFFFSALNRFDSLVNYEWKTDAGGSGRENSVTYRVPEDSVVSSGVSIKASHGKKFIQTANTGFLVQFGEQ